MAEKRQSTKHPNIFLYSNGRYYYRGTINGVRLDDHSLKTSKWSVALENARKLEALYGHGDAGSIKLRVEDTYPQYIEERRRRNKLPIDHKDHLRAKSLASTEYIFDNHLLPFFRFRALRDLTEELWAEYVKTKTVKIFNHKKEFRAYLKWCLKRGHLIRIPELENPDPPPRPGMQIDHDELMVILKEAKPHHFLFIMMYSTLAMRRSEILRLTWDRVFFKEKYIHLRAEDTKTGKPRNVPLNDDVLTLLKDRRKAVDSPYVFPNTKNKNKPSWGFSKAWKTLLKNTESDAKLWMHDLRRVWMTAAHTNPDLTDAQRERFAGSSVKVQKDLYAMIDIKETRAAADAVKLPRIKTLVRKKLKEGAK